MLLQVQPEPLNASQPGSWPGVKINHMGEEEGKRELNRLGKEEGNSQRRGEKGKGQGARGLGRERKA